jgi:hypothetical protein
VPIFEDQCILLSTHPRRSAPLLLLPRLVPGPALQQPEQVFTQGLDYTRLLTWQVPLQPSLMKRKRKFHKPTHRIHQNSFASSSLES